MKATLLMAGTFILLLSTIYAMVDPPARKNALVTAWGKKIDKNIDVTTKDGLKACFAESAARTALLEKVGVNKAIKPRNSKGLDFVAHSVLRQQ